MKSKKTYIVVGIILLIIAFAWSVVNDPSNIIETAGMAVKIRIIINIAITFTIIGIAERFFIKSGIVPKWIRFIIYWQWVVVPIVLIISIIDII